MNTKSLACFVALIPLAAHAEPSPEAKSALRREVARQGEELVIARTLKQRMKNPDSFKLERAFRTADSTVCFMFRATNSFNAIVPGYAVYTGRRLHVNGSDGFNRIWNRRCAHKDGDDLISVRQPL